MIVLGGETSGCQSAFWLHMLDHDISIIETKTPLGDLQLSSPCANNWAIGVMDNRGFIYTDSYKQAKIQDVFAIAIAAATVMADGLIVTKS